MATIKSPKRSRLENIPTGGTSVEQLLVIQRNLDFIWDRLNNIEDRIDKLEGV